MPKKKTTTAKQPAKGLGDVVAKVTSAIGIEPCEGCNKRKDYLNALFPFHRVTDLSEKDKEWLKNYFHNAGKVLSHDDATELFRIYSTAFNTTVDVCRSCTGLVNQIVKKLKKLSDASTKPE